MTDDISLEIETADPPETNLVVAFPGPGMGAISANQYLIEQLGLEETGHVRAEGLAAVTPFADGRPYHHTRLFTSESLECTLLTSELPIPTHLTEPFGRILLEWVEDNGVDEVTVLTTMPTLASDDLFYVASEDYYDRRLADRSESLSLSPLTGGFFTGVNASLTSRAIDTDLRVGVLATAVERPHVLDGDAALRLVEGLQEIYEFDVDTDELRQFADRTRDHYRELVEQVEAQTRAQQRPAVEDRGFM
ncbi:PAC2 family protein [Halobacteria archaeon AArc-m2/3/4]|uniref:PAC2 family protein n=1 Tax=Natronoglomus mannanivorans TaxID=2979990 RepID=A0AAP2Z4B3_9EURY|nr:PAC2 family protein [Halobacteria archaeon AArc-xg1-1]MCU4972837.1 PAC2 family protein [Halobacteria archaeon AArc-m2/3/4]